MRRQEQLSQCADPSPRRTAVTSFRRMTGVLPDVPAPPSPPGPEDARLGLLLEEALLGEDCGRSTIIGEMHQSHLRRVPTRAGGTQPGNEARTWEGGGSAIRDITCEWDGARVWERRARLDNSGDNSSSESFGIVGLDAIPAGNWPGIRDDCDGLDLPLLDQTTASSSSEEVIRRQGA